MKTILLALLVSAGCCAQTNNAAFNAFKKQLEAYQSNPANANLKPAKCSDYVLVYTVRGHNFSEIALPAKPQSLCPDLAKYDQSRNPNPDGLWRYDIKAVGDKYYVIRADKTVGSVIQEWYYYERKK